MWLFFVQQNIQNYPSLLETRTANVKNAPKGLTFLKKTWLNLSDFREKAKQYHPDAPDGDAEKFKRIGEAFELLSKNTTENAARRSGPRRKYDDFKFDDSDEEHRWAKMKKGILKQINCKLRW